MAGVITTGSFPKFLVPGINSAWGMAYNEKPREWALLYEMNTSDRAYEEDVGMTGVGLTPVKEQGNALSFDTMQQGYISRYTHVAYALGFIITREEIADNLYVEFGRDRARNIAFSMHQTKEIMGASPLNYAFTSTSGHLGGDGVCLVSDSHPIAGGNTLSNTLSSAADLSEASLEDALTDISQFKNDRNMLIGVRGKALVVPPQLGFDAVRILKNPDRPGTADRDINAIYSLGLLDQGIIVNHYLTDTDAWFILTDIQKGLRYFERESAVFESDNEFDTKNAKFSGYERYSFGWTDWRGIYGSPGA